MKGWRNIQTSLSKRTSFTLWASEMLCCRPCLIEMKKEGSLEKVRSYIMFGPHHNLVAWESWLFRKKKCKKCILRKGCGERLLHSCCSEKSVIASSSWEIYCTKRTCHVFIWNLQQLTKTKNLSEVVPVKLSSDDFSINQVAAALKTPLLLLWLLTPLLLLHPSEKLSHATELAPPTQRTAGGGLNICSGALSSCAHRDKVRAKGTGPAVGIWVSCIRAAGCFSKLSAQD